MNYYRCPNCSKDLPYPDQYAGKKAECPKCGHRITLPSDNNGPVSSEISTSGTGKWQVLVGKKALRLASQKNVVRQSHLNDAAVLVHSSDSQPSAVQIVGRVRCHICAASVPLDGRFFTAGVSSTRIECAACQHQVDAMATSVDGMMFLVASPGTQPNYGPVKPVALTIETVDGQPPATLDLAVSPERIEFLLGLVRAGSVDYAFKEELTEIGEPVVSELLEIFTHGPGTSSAGDVLTAIGPAAIPGLVELLRGESDELRSRTAQTISGIKPEGAAALIRVLADPRPTVRQSAVYYLRYAKAPAQEAIEALIKCLDDPEENIRRCAATSLGEHGKAANSAIPKLMEQLDQGNPCAGDSLVRIGPDAVGVVPKLLTAVDSGSTAAHEALTRAHLIGGTALPLLLPGLSHKNKAVRHAATCAVQSILHKSTADIPEGLIPALIRCLKDESDSIRQLSARSLEHIGPRAIAARKALKAGLKDPDKWTADAMRDALMAVCRDEKEDGFIQRIASWFGKTD